MGIRPSVQTAAWVLTCVIALGGGAEERAQVTTVKLSHMGCGGLALRGASGLLLPTFSSCFYCWLSSADCTGSCRIFFFNAHPYT